MEDIGFNWQRHQVKRPEWLDEAFLRITLILSILTLLFYTCKNIRITNTKYIRGRHISLV
jgi:hypothetical protein